MRQAALLLAGCALCVMPASVAGAGPCTTEIQALTKTLSATDAGSGSTGQTRAAERNEPSGTTGTAGTTGTGSARTGEKEHPPTAIMNKEADHSAASPGDVRRQTEGQPTAAEQAEGARTTGSNALQASAAVDRARTLDQQGRESECMDAVKQAKGLLSQH
jgi:hypothetical protein